MKNWTIKLSNKGKIIFDDFDYDDDSHCWNFLFAGEGESGFGVTRRTRQSCIKSILSNTKREIMDKERELKKLNNIYNYYKSLLIEKVI